MSKKKKNKRSSNAFARNLEIANEEARLAKQNLDKLINRSKLHLSSKLKAFSSSNDSQGSTKDQKKKKKKKKKDPEKEEIEEYEEDPKTRTRERSPKSEEGNSERHEYDNERHEYDNERHEYDNERHEYDNERHEYDNERHEYDNEGHEYDNEGHKSKGKRKKSKGKRKKSKRKSKRKEEENNERKEENNEREEENNEREEENNEREAVNYEREAVNYEREAVNYEREAVNNEGEEENNKGEEENNEGEEENNEGEEEEERDMEVVRAFECAKEPLKMIETVKKSGIKFLFDKQDTKKNEQKVNRQMLVKQDAKENKQIVNRQMFVRRKKKDLTQSTFSDEQNRNRIEDDARAECSYADYGIFNDIFPDSNNFYCAEEFPIYGCLYIYIGLGHPKVICSKTSLQENDECIPSDAGINEFVPRNERVLFLCVACAISTVKFQWFKCKKDTGKEIVKEEFQDTAPPTYFAYSQFFVENFGDQHQGEYHCRISCGETFVDCSVKIFLHLLDHMDYLSSMALRELGIEKRPSSTFGINYQYLSSASDNEHEEDSSSDERNSDQSSESDKYDSPMCKMYKAMCEAKRSSESIHYEKVKTDLEPIEGAVSLWVSGLSNQTRGYELVTLFSYQGELHDVTIVEDPSVSPPKRFAYIRMASEDDAQNCIDMSVELEAQEGYLVRKCEKEEEEAVKQCVREAALRDITLELLDERNDWKVFSAHNGMKLLHKDILTLFHQNWLNDEVIDFYLHMIVERSKQQLYPSVYAFGTSFYPKLRKGYYFVNSWTNGINVFAYDIIMMPVVSNIHRGLAVIDFRSKKIKLYDPLNILDSCFVMLRDYITRESVDKKRKYIDLTDWSYDNVENIPKLTENTSYDCGVFLLKYAECISRDVTEMTFKPANAPNYRLHMAYEIYSKQIL